MLRRLAVVNLDDVHELDLEDSINKPHITALMGG